VAINLDRSEVSLNFRAEQQSLTFEGCVYLVENNDGQTVRCVCMVNIKNSTKAAQAASNFSFNNALRMT